MILKGYLFGIGYALICLLLSFILYKLGLPKKYTRKAVHILVGFEWVILYNYMGAGIHFLAVCVLFLVLLAVAYKGSLMPMISSESDNAPGTVYYALAMTGVAAVGCFVPEVMLPFGIGVFATSVGDGFAGVVGQSVKKHNPKIYGDKTLLGTLTNLVLTTLSAFLISSLYSLEISLPLCLVIGVVSAGLELVTPYGLDNVAITWAATALGYSFMYFEGICNYLVPIISTPFIIAFATSKKALTRDGIAAAIILDLAVSLALGNAGFLVLCSFFLGAIVVDKVKKRVKKQTKVDINTDKDCRNYIQVAANGLVAFVCSVAFVVTNNPLCIIPFVASLAEAFADTVASGIGVFATTTYDPFRRKKCEKGISGGMSLEGTLASLVAAFLISFVAYLLGPYGYGVKEFFIVAGCAFFGAVLDSMLGSLLQVKYTCPTCGTLTEEKMHCDTPTVKQSGFEAIDNDVVNMISCSSAAILALLLSFVF